MFNKVILVGNLTRDIELRYSQGGMAIAKTALATSRKFSSNGERKEETCFIDITFFGRSAEIANQYLHKGSKILVEGRLTFEQWTDQTGGKRSKHSVTVENMQMLDSRGEAPGMGGGMDQGGYSQYDEPSYGAPQQQSYPQQGGGYNNAPQQRPYNAPKQNVPPRMPENTIPEIDIDEDEIPF